MTKKYKAFIFDLNGTLIDDMKFHTDAWYEVLVKELGADLSYEKVKAEMFGKNEEVLHRIFGEGHFEEKDIEKHSKAKEEKYQAMYKPNLKLIPGLEAFLAKAEDNNIMMAIGSAAIMFNIDFIIDNADIRKFFKVLISADEVTLSKPDPETFLKAAEALGVAPEDCLVFEDAPKGVEAADNAGMDALVITTLHGKEEFSHYNNIIGYISDYNDAFLDKLVS